jgi:hypothetical protein
MALETKNADGGVKGISVVQIITKSGQSFAVAVGEMNFTLTPRITEE